MEEGYYIFNELTNEEILAMSNGLHEMTGLLEEKEKESISNILEDYRHQMLNYPQEELEKGGSIYCNSNSQKIFVEDKNGNTVMIWE